MLRLRLMALRYLSGEEVKAGDHVIYHGERAKIEFISEPGELDAGRFFEQFGGGCMILAPSFGRVFDQPDEDLDFVSRGELPPK
jgi:hypothetical protein